MTKRRKHYLVDHIEVQLYRAEEKSSDMKHLMDLIKALYEVVYHHFNVRQRTSMALSVSGFIEYLRSLIGSYASRHRLHRAGWQIIDKIAQETGQPMPCLEVAA